MDAVITYVDGLDPLWQKDYAAAVGMETFMEKRFRDWGTLRYLLRGIRCCMPFVENVHLVVARESQIPSWADTERLHIVLHRDIIPEKYLPLFNSCAIEMFLHRIPGLAEKYLYFNDDFFPVLPFSEEDLYPGGKAAIYMKRQCLVAGNDYRMQVRMSDRLAREAAGLGRSPVYQRPQHTVAPMVRSACEELYAAMEDRILSSVTRLREPGNYNQYIYSDYMCYKGLTAQKRISNKHFSLAVAKVDKIVAFLREPDRQMVCINDVRLGEEKFQRFRKAILDAFQERFPEPCELEK